MGNYTLEIKAAADAYGLRAELIAAVIMQESSGIPDARRLEQGFYRRYLLKPDLPGYFPPDVPRGVELVCRATSWGLMQIMGQTARELGFRGRYFSELEHPAANINIGCRLLANLIKRRGGELQGLLGFNGGADPTCPGKVLAHISSGRIKKVL